VVGVDLKPKSLKKGNRVVWLRVVENSILLLEESGGRRRRRIPDLSWLPDSSVVKQLSFTWTLKSLNFLKLKILF
jgi:hypothetical protein